MESGEREGGRWKTTNASVPWLQDWMRGNNSMIDIMSQGTELGTEIYGDEIHDAMSMPCKLAHLHRPPTSKPWFTVPRRVTLVPLVTMPTPRSKMKIRRPKI
jgi:hypothetical protein